MAIEAQVVVQIVDTEPEQVGAQGVLFKSVKGTCIIAPEGTPIDVLVPLGKAKLDTTIEEARSDIMEQMDEAGREINPT
jgi:hypothetical protein